MLAAGTRLGPYEVVSLLGAGGMGEVYQALDTRLQRQVAIKVLSARFSEDPQMRQRFEREARSISSLSHSHICALYDVGHQTGTDFLIMEYIEGESLASRLAKGAIPLKEVLRYAIEIADALDNAHRRGIVHRDLKPANIMLTKSGIKLLDFGLAKLRDTTDVNTSGEWANPTKSHELTAKGTVLGTLQYMSPEQLEGKETDARTDIFSFGAILYEMATGRKAFTGTTITSLITSILKSDPEPIASLQPLISAHFENVVQGCLNKDPESRWQTAHDLLLQLKWIAEEGSQPNVKVGSRKAYRPWILTAGLLIVALLTGYATSHFISRTSKLKNNPNVVKLSFLLPEAISLDAGSVEISPDGKRIAFVGINNEGRNSIWLRSLDSMKLTELSGTDGAAFPFWSPTGEAIGFFAQGKLKTVNIAGGTPKILCDASNVPRGGTWNNAGTILFSPTGIGRIFRVAAEGGQVLPVTTFDESHRENAHRWPYFLPDGNHFIYSIRCGKADRAFGGDSTGVYIGSLNSSEKKQIMNDFTKVQYSSGHLLFVRKNVLIAKRFDLNKLQFTSGEIKLEEKVDESESSTGGPATATFSVSQNGVLAFVNPDISKSHTSLNWFDRNGSQVGSVADSEGYSGLNLSPDEKKIVANYGGELRIIDLDKGTSTRLTLFNGSSPVWSPDGKEIAFASDQGGSVDIFVKPSNGNGKDQRVLQQAGPPTDWSLDGRYILFGKRDEQTRYDLWMLPLFGDRKPAAYLQTDFYESGAVLSPNGKWVAYESDETGGSEIYVRSFANPTAQKWKISSNGGSMPKWRRDGKELFYIGANHKLMAVKVKTDLDFQVSTPVELFYVDGEYVVINNGQKFLLDQRIQDSTMVSPINVILNWPAMFESK
jgi:eukaryotic-like serine/threonine-protein kinase